MVSVLACAGLWTVRMMTRRERDHSVLEQKSSASSFSQQQKQHKRS